jgi:glycosyltransferase involved in cell wall biosynthesis
MSHSKRILILYRELAGYTVQCINHLCEVYDAKVDVVAFPINSDAPFQFQFSQNVTLESRANHTEISLLQKVEKTKYDLIFVGGWSDKAYLNCAKKAKQTKCVLAFDTWWFGNLKQQLAVLYARFFIAPHFQYAFVPGVEQRALGLKMGFNNEQIVDGVYSCDVPRFAKISELNKSNFDNDVKNLMYVGRYSSEKFIEELQMVFLELWQEGYKQWNLICAGTGALYEKRIQHAAIKHLGFLQPESLFEEMKHCVAFALPSTFEPWGVVVHEFAAAGVPMVLSSSVGAKGAFLEENKNGYVFESTNTADLKVKLKLLFSQSNENLRNMGQHSHALAQKISPDTWAKSLLNMIE